MRLEHPYENRDYDEANAPWDQSSDEEEKKTARKEARGTTRQTAGEEDFDRNFWARDRQELPAAVQDLRTLFKLAEGAKIRIQVVGGGARNGCDLGTQTKVKEIARVVKRLRGEFKDVRVAKVLYNKKFGSFPAQDITSWWEGHESITRQRV